MFRATSFSITSGWRFDIPQYLGGLTFLTENYHNKLEVFKNGCSVFSGNLRELHYLSDVFDWVTVRTDRGHVFVCLNVPKLKREDKNALIQIEITDIDDTKFHIKKGFYRLIGVTDKSAQ